MKLNLKKIFKRKNHEEPIDYESKNNDHILELLQLYYGKYDYIIEYGNNQRLRVGKNTILSILGDFIEYYGRDFDDSKDNIPLGIIYIPSITAIKRSTV